MKYQIVVARYKESVDWLVNNKDLYENCIIFNKGEPLGLDKEIQISNNPDFGREGDTYLFYLITNHSKLPEYVFFTQANPFDHSPDFIDLVKYFVQNPDKLKPYQPLSVGWKNSEFSSAIDSGVLPHPWHLDYNILHDVDRFKLYVEILDDKLLPIGHQADFGMIQTLSRFRRLHNITNPDDTLRYLYDRLTLPPPYIGYIFFNYGAIFGVSKENILYHSIEYYKFLRNFLLENSCHGYILERLWYSIFRDGYYRKLNAKTNNK